MKVLETAVMQLSKRALDVYNKQHQAIAENVAQANVPDYKRKKTEFSELLVGEISTRLKTTQAKHFSESSYTPISKDETEDKVDISQEMGYLAENQIKFDFAARALNKMYRKLTMSITGRQIG